MSLKCVEPFNQVFDLLLTSAPNICHGGIKSGVCYDTAVGEVRTVGNGGVGEPTSVLILVCRLSQEMKLVFDHAVAGREATRRMADIKQEDRTVSDYSIEFRNSGSRVYLE